LNPINFRVCAEPAEMNNTEQMDDQKENKSANIKNKIALVALIILFVVAVKFGLRTSDDAVDESPGSKIIGSGAITTLVDGVDVHTVNLWTSTKPERKVACTVVMGQKLRVISISGEYYYVEAVGRTGCEGYCMKGFVALN